MSKKTRGRYVAAKNTGGSKMKKYAFGIDVGGTTCKIGFFETNGKLIDNGRLRPTRKITEQQSCLISHRQLIINWHRKASAKMMYRVLESVFQVRLRATVL